MADKTSSVINVRYGQQAPYLVTHFDVPDIDDGDTVKVKGLSRVKNAIVQVTGTTEDVVQVASLSGNTITFEGGANSPVHVEAKGWR